MVDGRPSRAARTLLALEHNAERRWFLPAVGVFPLCDYILPFLPNQILLAGLSMTLPWRWVSLAVTFVLATALGACLIAFAIQHFGLPMLEQYVGPLTQSDAFAPVLEPIRDYGLIALIGFAMLPWPPRTAVVACALAGLPPVGIGFAVFVGRTLPATLYAAIGAKAPHVLRRFASIDKIMLEVEDAKSKGPLR